MQEMRYSTIKKRKIYYISNIRSYFREKIYELSDVHLKKNESGYTNNWDWIIKDKENGIGDREDER